MIPSAGQDGITWRLGVFGQENNTGVEPRFIQLGKGY